MGQYQHETYGSGLTDNIECLQHIFENMSVRSHLHKSRLQWRAARILNCRTHDQLPNRAHHGTAFQRKEAVLSVCVCMCVCVLCVLCVCCV